MIEKIWSRASYYADAKVHLFFPDRNSGLNWISLCGRHNRAKLNDRSDGETCAVCRVKLRKYCG